MIINREVTRAARGIGTLVREIERLHDKNGKMLAALEMAVASYSTPRVAGERRVSISIDAFKALEAAIAEPKGGTP
jgi:hypothetical protein